MSKRNRREHGRIISVETLTRGDALAADVAAGATSIAVNDAGDFDEDGGWLYIGAQTVEYTDCDDDAGVITLADPLTAAGEQGDPVQVWSDLYDEVVDYQLALVELDGEYDNPDPVAAEVAEGVGDLPEGDRGKAGESCTLLRVADDEWEVVGVGGRARKSRGLRAEMHDVHAVAAAGLQTFTLSHVPINEGLIVDWHPAGGAGVRQPPQNFTVDYSSGVITFPDTERLLAAGDELRVWYLYRKGLPRTRYLIPFGADGWKYLRNLSRTDATDYSVTAFDDTAWATGACAFGSDNVGGAGYDTYGGYKTSWNLDTRMWLRRHFGRVTSATVTVRLDNYADVYWNGTLVQSLSHVTGNLEDYANPYSVDIPDSLLDPTSNVLAVRGTDDGVATGTDIALLDVKVTWTGDAS